MNVRNCLTATVAALATMAIVVVTSWPTILDAKGPAPVAKAAKVIKTPTMTVSGCTLSFIPRDQAAGADQEYVVRLKAVNTTDTPVSFDMTVSVMSQSPGSMFSRMPVMPKESWTHTCPISLAAGETTVISLPTGKKASALGVLLSTRVTVDGKHLVGGRFSALTPAKTPNGGLQINAKAVALAPSAVKRLVAAGRGG